jgi:Flp pilus assembly protein CpaB
VARSPRNIAVIVALAVVAVLLYLHYHRSSRNTAFVPITVLVAKHEIPMGTRGDVIRTHPGFYRVVLVRKSQVEPGAVVDPSTLTGKVALTQIYPNQPLTAAEFGSALSIGLGPPLQRAVVITPKEEIDGPINVGSHVDVLVTNRRHDSQSRPSLREVFRNMYVLNVSTSADTVTLRALTPTQAGTLYRLSGPANDRLIVRRSK